MTLFKKSLYTKDDETEEIIPDDPNNNEEDEEDDEDEDGDDDEIAAENVKKFGDIAVMGEGWIPRPIGSFDAAVAHIKSTRVKQLLANAIKGLGLTDPTLIQSCCIPSALSGRDLLVNILLKLFLYA